MKIEFYTTEDNKYHVLDNKTLTEVVIEYNLSPEDQIDAVESNPSLEASAVRYAILFDDNDNVVKMFVREPFPE